MRDVKYELLLRCLLTDDNDLGCPDARNSVLVMALDIIRDIKAVVRSGYNDDEQAMSDIVAILERYGIDCGIRRRMPTVYRIEEEYEQQKTPQ